MKLIKHLFCYLFLFLPLILNSQELVSVNAPKTFLWNVSNLEYLKFNSHHHKKTYKRIIKGADKYCKSPSVVVTDKNNTFAPDNHYYCSLGGYWWPDSLNTGKYIHKDVKCPVSKDFDAFRLTDFRNRCVYLSVAYFLTKDTKYYECFIDQIKAWFIDQETFMYPNFECAAVVPGKNRNKGRTSGMIQAYSFIDVIESILLVDSISHIDDIILSSIKKWFSDFVNWSENGRFGAVLQKADNNIGIAYDVMLTEMYLFIDEKDKAKEIVDNFSVKRLKAQIDKDGKQEAELKRTNAFAYSLYNLSHILDFCFISNYWEIDFYRNNQDVINLAYSYLQQYENSPEKFPYQQKSDWSKCKQQLHSQLLRRERLRGKDSNIFKDSDRFISLNALLN